jgi:ankyrin repeat protein
VLRRHVLHDLQPYTCTFEHCPSTLFASRHAWFDHELAAHRKEWNCGICSVRTKSASAFVEHAQSIHHRTFPEKLLSKVLQQNERSQTRYKANDCPFCDDWTVVHDDRNVPEDEIHITVKQFRLHVGRHMEELALFVLPVDIGDDFQSQKAAGEADSFDSSQSMFSANEFGSSTNSAAGLAEQLLNACNHGDVEEVRKLVAGGVNVNVEFKDGSTPLTKAVESESFSLAELLISVGAKADHVNKYGDTAFAYAVRHDHMSLVELFCKSGHDVNIKRQDGETLLMTAATHNRSFQMLNLLVTAGADVSAKDTNGRTALLLYFSGGSTLETDWEAALDILSGPSVDIEAVDDISDGFRILHWTAYLGFSKVCRRLLQLGADIDARDKDGRTPLRIAIIFEVREVALLLLDMGADVGEIYPTDLHPEAKLLLGWASSNDRLHVGKLVAHKQRMPDEKNGIGILRRVTKVIRLDSP